LIFTHSFEFLSIYHGLTLAMNQGLRQVIIEGDALKSYQHPRRVFLRLVPIIRLVAKSLTLVV